MSICERVNPCIGSDNHIDFSFGNCLPLMTLPWGTHHYSPVNAEDARWFFQYRAHRFQGLRLTHQPSPWMGDWCHLTLMAQSSSRRCRSAERAVDVASRDLVCKPHRFAATLPSEDLLIEAAPTMHGLVLRLTRRQGQACRLIIDSAEAGAKRGAHPSRITITPERNEIIISTASGNGHAEFRLHWILHSSVPIQAAGIFTAEADQDGQLSGEGPALGAWLEFAAGSQAITLRSAGSFIDAEAARSLLDQEIGSADLADIQDTAAQTWEALLGRIVAPGLGDEREIFLRTSIYRTLCFPRRLDETGPDGMTRHRCPDTGSVRSGVRVTDNGFWDTARSVYSWYALFCPDHLGVILEGWLNGARSSGWFASWASPGHRACMTGSYADVIYADALARGIGGWDVAEVLQYLRKHAEVPVADNCPYGRIGLDAYLALGYVPHERCSKATARTLDYAYGDWCLARLADQVGDTAFATACRQRSGAWRQVLDPVSGFFRGRHADGRWLEPFDPIAWGGPYVEGSAWQFAWHVPHDHAGLIAARGGSGPALAFLEALLTQAPRYTVGTYGHVIHEMREMAAVDFGQYAHSNQPSHFTLPYLAHCGADARWNMVTQRVLTDLHRAQPDGLPGDEDNGEMSAWWLTAALGLVADCPGSSSWLRVQPLIRDWTLRRPGLSDLRVHTSGPGSTWTHDHGLPVNGLHVEHATLNRGGTWTVS